VAIPILAADNTTILENSSHGNYAALGFDVVGDTYLGAPAGKVVALQLAGSTVAQFGAASTDFAGFGAAPATAGVLRFSYAGSLVTFAALGVSGVNIGLWSLDPAIGISFGINSAAQASNVGTAVTIRAQDGGPVGPTNGGKLTLRPGSPGGAGQAGALDLENLSTTTNAPAAGGAGALPATPKGYVTIQIDGTNQQIAYY
jgi:hypothetical protein